MRSLREIAAELAFEADDIQRRCDAANALLSTAKTREEKEAGYDAHRSAHAQGAGACLGIGRRISAELALLDERRPYCAVCAFVGDEERARLVDEGRRANEEQRAYWKRKRAAEEAGKAESQSEGEAV